MDICTTSTHLPTLWWSGAIIHFVFLSLAAIPLKGESQTIGTTLLIIVYAAILATMWPFVDGIILFVLGLMLSIVLAEIICLVYAKTLGPIMKYKIRR